MKKLHIQQYGICFLGINMQTKYLLVCAALCGMLHQLHCMEQSLETTLKEIDSYLSIIAHVKAKDTEFTWLANKTEFIIQQRDINATDDLGNTRLHYAAFLDIIPEMITLINLGADPTKVNNNGQDFLAILEILIAQEKKPAQKMALTRSYQQLLRAIAQKNVHVRFGNGDNLLHKAVFKQDAPLVVELLASIDPNQTNNFNMTPLHIAAGESLADPMILNQLLIHKANPNMQTDLGNTPLHMAARNFMGNPLIINKLLEHGASPDIQNKNSETSTHVLLQKINELVKEYSLLKKKGNPTSQQMQESFDLIKRAIIALFDLVEYSKNNNIQDNFGNTALYHLVFLMGSSEPEIKKALMNIFLGLLELPATNPNIQNKDGFTPLHAAVIAQDPELVNLLVKHAANPFIRSYKPRTMADIKRGKPLEPNKTPRDIVDELKAATPELKQLPLLKIEESLLQAELYNPQLAHITPPLPAPTIIPAIRTPSPLEQESPVQPKKMPVTLETALHDLTVSLQELHGKLL